MAGRVVVGIPPHYASVGPPEITSHSRTSACGDATTCPDGARVSPHSRKNRLRPASTGMMAFSRSVLVFALLGCDAPVPASTPGAAPAAALDRRHDPAFALKKDGSKFVGRVANERPWDGHAPQ